MGKITAALLPKVSGSLQMRVPKIEKISPSSAGSQATFAFNLVILLGRGSTRPSASVQRLATRYNPLIASKNR